MALPFTVEQFFEVFSRYNEGVWPAQVVLNLVGFGCILILFRPAPVVDRIVSGALASLWAWMAVAYHFVFFTSINPAAWGFGGLFLIGSLLIAWFGVLKGRLHFQIIGGLRGTAGSILLVFALVLYPLIGYLAGHRYPATPTFGLPCPTTIFTLGLLLFARRPLPRAVLAVPVVWAFIGSFAAFKLGVTQDLALIVAAAMGILSASQPMRRETVSVD